MFLCQRLTWLLSGSARQALGDTLFEIPERFQPLGGRERELRLENSCDEFPGRLGSHLVIPVASDPTMGSARAGPFKSDRGDEDA